MKTFSEYASQRSVNNLAVTIVEGGYDIEEVTGFLHSIIEENEHQDGEVLGEVIYNEFLSSMMRAGSQGSQIEEIRQAVKKLNNVAVRLEQLGVTNPQVQQLFSQLNNHLTQLSQKVAGDRTARVGQQGNVVTQMPQASNRRGA